MTCSCTATSMGRPSWVARSPTAVEMRSRSLPSTTTRWSGATLATACSACESMLRPPRVCNTFGVSERSLEPAPAASTSTADSLVVVM